MFTFALDGDRTSLVKSFSVAGLATLILAIQLCRASADEGRNLGDSAELIVETNLADTPEDAHGCRAIRIDLGQRVSNEVLTVKWTASNGREGSDLELPRSTSSCGCIRGFPPGLSIKRGKNAIVAFQLQVPVEEGAIAKQIAFFDNGGNCRMRLEIELESISPFLIPDVVSLKGEGKQSIRIPLRFRGELKSFDEISLNAFGTGVLGAQLRSPDRNNDAFIDLEVDTALVASESHIRVEFEFFSSQRVAPKSRVVRYVRIQDRPFSNPKVLILHYDSGQWVGKFRLYASSKGLNSISTEKPAVVLYTQNGEILDKQANVLPIDVSEVNSSEGIDCQIRIDDSQGQLRKNGIITAQLTLEGGKISLKCMTKP